MQRAQLLTRRDKVPETAAHVCASIIDFIDDGTINYSLCLLITYAHNNLGKKDYFFCNFFIVALALATQSCHRLTLEYP
ncbi:MAG: hypothetical protein ACI83P_001196 [Janthinobacterium sp.]